MEILLQSRFSFLSAEHDSTITTAGGKELNELPTNYLLPFGLNYRGPYVQSGQEVKLSRDVLISDLFQRHLPCLCTTYEIMNDSDWGPHWRESSRTKRVKLLTF